MVMKKYVLSVMVILMLAVLPGEIWAQGGWPPLEVTSSLNQQTDSGLYRYDVLLENVSDVDLIDVVVTLTLPEGVAFNHFEAIDYATTGFDGQSLSFTVLLLPAGQTIGPMATYLQVAGDVPGDLQTSIYAEWRGQMPGTLYLPAVSMGGPEGAAGTGATIEEAAPVPDATEPPSPPPVPTPTPEAALAETQEPEAEVYEMAAAAQVSFQLWDMLDVLKAHDFVDLTNSFAPGVPRWPGDPDAEFNTIADYDTDGFLVQEFVHVGQYGTHMDAPAHFHKGLRTIDQIDVTEMIAPLVVINVADKVAANPDYELTVDDVKAWETQYGPIPEGAFVAMRSDWSKRWPDVDAYANKDASGQAHYPGWTVEALKYLYEDRQIIGNGHEPLDTDAAVAQNETGFAAESYVLGTDHYQIELLTNLDKVPEAGAVVIVAAPKPQSGSGFPARVFAIVP